MGIVVLRDHLAMPWANGGGISYEIARFPAEGNFDWRISLADVDGHGPFSVMNGIDRCLVLLEGDHINLTNGDATYLVEEHVPFYFPGETAFECTLGSGQARDLNIMSRRGAVESDVQVLNDGTHNIAAASGTHFIVCIAGETEIEDIVLKYRDAAIITGDNLVTSNGTFVHIVLGKVL